MDAATAVRKALHRLLPTLSERTWAYLDALILSEGSVRSAHAAAAQLGLQNRFALARLLRADGLPPPHQLADWIRVLLWVSSWERHPVSLFRLAVQCHKNPAVCYRAVKRLTGLHWTEVRTRGLDWLVRSFAHRCVQVQRVSAPSRGRGATERASVSTHAQTPTARKSGIRGTDVPPRSRR